MQREFIPISESGMEIVEYISETFPCAIFNADIGKYHPGYVPWHWHEEIEIYVVVSGKLKVHLSDQSYILSENQGAFINSNVLHAMTIAEGTACELITVLFSPAIFTGGKNTPYYNQVTQTILGNENIQSHTFNSDNIIGQDFILTVKDILKIYTTDTAYKDLMIGEHLSKLWRFLLSDINEVKRHHINKVQESRTQAMMTYIHDNYMHALTLEKIANSVSISPRECSRCFHKTINTTAIKYLMSYRISKSLHLLSSTNETMTSIASAVGFNSSSYFTKTFIHTMKMTPSEYRKRYK